MYTLALTSLALFYGFTMKVADLLDEHGLRWFKGDALLFGVLWGAFGAMLVMGDPVVASAIVAQNVAFIARNRLDYRNHQIAATAIIGAGIIFQIIPPLPFGIFLVVFLIFGTLCDYAEVIGAKGFWAGLNELAGYYAISSFIYCLILGHWIIFAVLTAYIGAYDLVKIIARRHGYS